jgi:CRP-like cAMP-binding protein
MSVRCWQHLHAHIDRPAFDFAGSVSVPLRVQVWASPHDSAKEQAVESSNIQKPFRNRILASLPAPDAAHITPLLSPRVFKRDQTLHDPGQMIETIYFLEDGVCSIVVTMEDGTTVEVGIIGSEGLVGMAALLGAGHSPCRNLIQIAGSGYAIKAKTFAEHCHNGSSQLRLLLQRGVQGLFTQATQTAACNGAHEVEERLARRLLMCHDRMQADDLPLTHESLAMMLGTRRASVTVAAGILQKAGLIEHLRGHVRIVDRKGLEKAACECYSVIHNEYVRLGLFSEAQRPQIPPASLAPHRGVMLNGSNAGKRIGEVA